MGYDGGVEGDGGEGAWDYDDGGFWGEGTHFKCGLEVDRRVVMERTKVGFSAMVERRVLGVMKMINRLGYERCK